jgi:hypothetical protein
MLEIYFGQLDQIHPTDVLAEAAAAASDLRPVFTGLLLILAMIACARLLSTAAHVAGVLLELLKDLIRYLILAALAALVVFAVLIFAIADLLATG